MKNKRHLSWSNRLKLCWEVLTRGKYDPRDYKTILEEEVHERCEKMRSDLRKGERQRTGPKKESEWD